MIQCQLTTFLFSYVMITLTRDIAGKDRGVVPCSPVLFALSSCHGKLKASGQERKEKGEHTLQGRAEAGKAAGETINNPLNIYIWYIRHKCRSLEEVGTTVLKSAVVWRIL